MTSTTQTQKSAPAVQRSFQHQLGKRLQLLRESEGLSQTELGARIDMSRVGVGYIEQGRRAPSLHTLEDLARLYRMSVSQLVDISDLVDNGSTKAEI